jgi:hypothetical protein
MKVENLRSLIRESINEYIREIDNAGNKAALEAKMTATQEAIDLRKKKMSMEGLDEAYHDMLDKGKMKELSGEVKALEKSLTKLKKQLDKLNSKSEPKTEVIKDEPVEEGDAMDSMKNAIVPEVELEEARFKKGTDIGKKGKGFEKIAKAAGKEYGSKEAGKRVAGSILKKVLNKEGEEATINESFLKMQKMAGVITEAQYNQRKSLVENQLNEFDLNTAMKASPERHSYNDVLEVIKSYENEDMLDKFMGEFPQGKDISRDDYGRFCMSYMDDMSEQQYIQANWISITDPDIFEKAGLV